MTPTSKRKSPQSQTSSASSSSQKRQSPFRQAASVDIRRYFQPAQKRSPVDSPGTCVSAAAAPLPANETPATPSKQNSPKEEKVKTPVRIRDSLSLSLKSPVPNGSWFDQFQTPEAKSGDIVTSTGKSADQDVDQDESDDERVLPSPRRPQKLLKTGPQPFRVVLSSDDELHDDNDKTQLTSNCMTPSKPISKNILEHSADDDDSDQDELPKFNSGSRSAKSSKSMIVSDDSDNDELPPITLNNTKKQSAKRTKIDEIQEIEQVPARRLSRRSRVPSEDSVADTKSMIVSDDSDNDDLPPIKSKNAEKKSAKRTKIDEIQVIEQVPARRLSRRSRVPSEDSVADVKNHDKSSDDDELPSLYNQKKKKTVQSEFSLANLMKQAKEKKQLKTDWESISTALASRAEKTSNIAPVLKEEGEDEFDMGEWSWDKLQERLQVDENNVKGEGYLFESSPVLRLKIKQQLPQNQDLDVFNDSQSGDTFIDMMRQLPEEERLSRLRIGAVKLWINHVPKISSHCMFEWLWNIVSYNSDMKMVLLARNTLEHYFLSENQQDANSGWYISWIHFSSTVLNCTEISLDSDFFSFDAFLDTAKDGAASESQSQHLCKNLGCVLHLLLVSLQTRDQHYADLSIETRFKWLDLLVLIGLASQFESLQSIAIQCFSELVYSNDTIYDEKEAEESYFQQLVSYFGALSTKMKDHWTRVGLLRWLHLSTSDQQRQLVVMAAWIFLNEAAVWSETKSDQSLSSVSYSPNETPITLPSSASVMFAEIQKLLQNRSDLLPTNQTNFQLYYFQIHYLFLVLNTELDKLVQVQLPTDSMKTQLNFLKSIILMIRKWEQRIHDAKAAHMDRTTCKEIMTRGCFQLHNRFKAISHELKLGLRAVNPSTGYDEEDTVGGKVNRKRLWNPNGQHSIKNRPTATRLLMGDSDVEA